MEACHPKLLSLFSKLELWHLCKSMLPSAKGLSIYVRLAKAPIREHLCHFYALLLTVLSVTMTGSSLPWITMFSQPLVFEGALHLCFAVSERASELPSIHTVHVVLIEVLTFEACYYLLASWLCHWYEFTVRPRCHLLMWFACDLAETLDMS